MTRNRFLLAALLFAATVLVIVAAGAIPAAATANSTHPNQPVGGSLPVTGADLNGLRALALGVFAAGCILVALAQLVAARGWRR